MKPIDRYKQVQAMRNTVHPIHECDDLSAGVFFARVVILVVLVVLLLDWVGMFP